MCLKACLLHSIPISFASQYHHYPSVEHLATHQGMSLGQKIIHVHNSEKPFMQQVLYTLRQKEHQLFCYN